MSVCTADSTYFDGINIRSAVQLAYRTRRK